MLRHPTAILILLSIAVLTSCRRQDNAATAFIRVANDGQTARQYEVFRDTQMQLIVSPFILNKAIQELDKSQLEILVGTDQVAWLQDNLQLQAPGKGEIVSVSLTAADSDEARIVVDAVVSTYLDEVANTVREENERRLQELRTKNAALREDLKDQLAQIDALEKAVGHPDAESEAIERRSHVHQLEINRERIAKLEDQLLEAGIAAAETGSESDDDVRVKMLTEHMAKLRLENEQLLEGLRKSDLMLVELEERKAGLEGLQKDLDGISNEISQLEKRISGPPPVTMVQPATVVVR